MGQTNERKINYFFEVSKTKAAFLFALAAVVLFPFYLGSETQNITTYYPAPYGSYKRFKGEFLKAGSIDSYIEAGRGYKTVDGFDLVNRNVNEPDYIFSNQQLYIKSDTGTLTLNTANNRIEFLNDTPSVYAAYLSNFCYWSVNASCNAGFIPMAKGHSLGYIAYGEAAWPNRALCCRATKG